MELFILFFSGILLGIAYILEKQLAAENYHPATFVLLVSAVSTLLSIPLLLYQLKISSSIVYWILTIGSVGAYGLGNLFSYKAYRTSDASVVGLINRLSIVVAAIFGIALLKELYTLTSYIALLLIFAGSVLIVFEKGTIRINAGVMYAVLMAVGYGISAVMDKEILKQFSPFTYVVINNFLVALLFSSFHQARKEAYRLFLNKSLLVICIALLSVSSWVGFLFVLQSGAVSRIFPIFDSLSLVSTVGAGIIFLKERSQMAQKIIGTIIVLAGIFLL